MWSELGWTVDIDFARKLERERDEAREYADKLAEGLPEGMLPKDVEVLREANLNLATNIAAVTEQLDSYKERYLKLAGKYAIEMHEITEQRDRLAEALRECRKDSVCEQARMENRRDWAAAKKSQSNIDRADEALRYLTTKP
jgi:hypothetical protein